MTDEKGIDPKIIAVPGDAVSKDYQHIQNLADIPASERKRIETFFQEYKKNDIQGKWSESHGWEDLEAAHKTILECVTRWKTSSDFKSAKASTPPKP